MLIEISELHPAAPGRKTGTIVAVGGTRFSVWPEQLAQVQVGRRYDVEISERTWQGRTLQSVTKITPYGNGDSTIAAKAATRTAAVAPGNGFGTASTSGLDRQMFVHGLLVALIRAGQVGNDKVHLYRTTTMLMQLYEHTLANGNDGASMASGAGQRHE
jgi:hypothetical protein